ncbi:MAG: UDP-N-acetylmuramoyl-L-alanyl-D-glutamate--2,6-diaminopimelate ligase [Pirellulaceae bacterium]|nr:UDP-N-acetylmuramoyl-L-alanyl-D-glutamate--2,6-diaminopimelate ligase [Pirellulaceae bacterium]
MASTQLRPRFVSLRETLPQAQFLRGGDVRASRLTADWRDCGPGDLFVALTTADDDGHEHAAQAVARGAAAVLAERLVPVDAPVVLTPDTREALGRVAQALAGQPSLRMRTIGVSGSAGKTVTSILLASIFEASGEAVGVVSSAGNSDSRSQTGPKHAAPTALELADWLGRMAEAGCESAVVELNSRALAERRAAGIELDAAVLTNLRPGQLDLHNTAQGYTRAKRRLFTLLKSGGVAVLNADDHRSRNLLPSLDVPCLTFGLHLEADLSAQVLERHKSEQTFLLIAGDESAPVRTRMIGDHHVANCLAAAAVGLASGLDLATIVRGLEGVERVPGRLERLECGQNFGVFVDSANTPETLALSLKTVRQVTSGRVIVVAGCQGGKNRAARPLVGRVLERGANLAVLTNDNPRYEEPLAIMHDLLDGFERPQRAHPLPDRAAAIRWALSQARAGDSVVIAGKGDRAGQVVGKRRLAHDDREIACEWLYTRGAEELKCPKLRIFR